MKGLYKEIKGLIDPLEAREISDVIKKSQKNNGDPQVPKSHSYYNLPVCNILLGKLLSQCSKASGKKLKPSYAYCRVYLKGAILKSHKDRPSCEYSITLNLSQTDPWPIFMGKKPVTLNPGDGVLYKGCEIEHSREEFKGEEYVQVFLHYVDGDGPYKDHCYDQLNEKKDEPIYRFLFRPIDLVSNHDNYYKYSSFFPDETISHIISLCEGLELNDAQIGDGDGAINKTKRRTQICWIPRTQDFLPLYKSLFEAVVKCNNNFFHFTLDEMMENIQYSVYNSEENGFYDWHTDMGPNNNRKLSLICHLSDPSEYEGGELQLTLGRGIDTPECTKGTVIVFPSYIVHRVTPVTRGTRRTLVLWFKGPPLT